MMSASKRVEDQSASMSERVAVAETNQESPLTSNTFDTLTPLSTNEIIFQQRRIIDSLSSRIALLTEDNSRLVRVCPPNGEPGKSSHALCSFCLNSGLPPENRLRGVAARQYSPSLLVRVFTIMQHYGDNWKKVPTYTAGAEVTASVSGEKGLLPTPPPSISSVVASKEGLLPNPSDGMAVLVPPLSQPQPMLPPNLPNLPPAAMVGASNTNMNPYAQMALNPYAVNSMNPYVGNINPYSRNQFKPDYSQYGQEFEHPNNTYGRVPEGLLDRRELQERKDILSHKESRPTTKLITPHNLAQAPSLPPTHHFPPPGPHNLPPSGALAAASRASSRNNSVVCPGSRAGSPKNNAANAAMRFKLSPWEAPPKRIDKNQDLSEHEKFARKLRGYLNKLTIERFESLCKQILDSGFASILDVKAAVTMIFEKATTQHHYIGMYTELCRRLNEHLDDYCVGLDRTEKSFRRILLDQCQDSFNKYLEPPPNTDSEDPELYFKYKRSMLGNIKFIGELIDKSMISSRVIKEIVNECLERAEERHIETAIELLKAIGSSFDNQEFHRQEELDLCFGRLKKMLKSPKTTVRSQCLIKDLLELRSTSWKNTRTALAKAAPSALKVHRSVGQGQGPNIFRRESH
eukprot:Platyproteum_vivax@DN2498_c0_g1_i1.p1